MSFLIRFVKKFLSTNSTSYIVFVLSWKDALKLIPKFDLFHGFILESYKYGKTKVRIIIINSQIVHQILKVQQHCCRVIALGPVLRLNIEWKDLESKNSSFQNNFWMISIVFDFLNLRHELHKNVLSRPQAKKNQTKAILALHSLTNWVICTRIDSIHITGYPKVYTDSKIYTDTKWYIH